MAHFCPLWISSKWLIFNILVSYCSVISLLISYTLLSCFFSFFLLLLVLFFLLLLLFFIQSSLSVLRDWFQYPVLWLLQWHSQSSASVVLYTRFRTCSFISAVQRANCTCHPLLFPLSPPILEYPLFYSVFLPSSCFPFSCLLGYKLPFISMKFLLQRDFLAVILPFWMDLVCKTKLPSEARYLLHELFGVQSKSWRKKIEVY